MAGRGTDILLGGSAREMARLRVRESLAVAAALEVLLPKNVSFENEKHLPLSSSEYHF